MIDKRIDDIEKRVAALEKIIKEQQHIIDCIRGNTMKHNEPTIQNSRNCYSDGGTMLL